MVETNKQQQSDVGDEGYDQAEDPEVTDNWIEELDRIRDKLMPYQRPIMIVGIIILIFLVVFMGYAYGGLKVCSELDGLLDKSFKCHPNYKPVMIYNERVTSVPDYTFNVT